MSVKITDWDPSEYLDNEESITAYLNAAFEDGDPQLIASAIGDVARAQGMTQIARETGLAREALYRALSEKGNPELGTVIGVLKSLKLRVRVEQSEQGTAEEIRSGPEISSLYSSIESTEIFSASIAANGTTIFVGSRHGSSGAYDEHDRPFIRFTGEISRTRIRSKISRAGSASTGAALKHATRPA